MVPRSELVRFLKLLKPSVRGIFLISIRQPELDSNKLLLIADL
jgi:hypothetical protein